MYVVKQIYNTIIRDWLQAWERKSVESINVLTKKDVDVTVIIITQ